MKKNITSANAFNKASTVIALSIILGTVVYAWTGPTGIAPTNNVAAPINVSATNQTKLGSLGLGTATLVGEMFRVLGDATFTGKAYSSPTVNTDSASTLVTKSYVDAKIAELSANSSGCPKLADGSYSIVISTDRLNGFSLYQAAVACGGINLLIPQKFTITLDTGISVAGMWIDSLVNGSTVKIVNNGKIVGAGGLGGVWSPGGAGGSAITSVVPLVIDNTNGLIGGGGGGGSGGYSGGGGGGAGLPPGQGGMPDGSYVGWNGSNGTLMTGGLGCQYVLSGNANDPGNGGNLGQAGGGSIYGPGGVAGYSVQTNGVGITWIATGDVRGPTN